MPLGQLFAKRLGSAAAPLDDGAWLPAPQTHPVPADDGPASDLAVQARLRREREVREARGEDDATVCLGPEPYGQGTVAAWSLPFLVGGAALAAAGIWNLSGGFHVGWLIGALIGSFATLVAGHALLGLTNPRLSLRCDRATFAPGEPAVIRWRFSRPPRRARGLSIGLFGEERATYRQGTNDTTATDTFFEAVLVDLPAAAGPPPVEGSFGLTLPADAMHSFESRNNAIAWGLVARAPVAFWPDAVRTVPLRVWSGPEPAPSVEERA